MLYEIEVVEGLEQIALAELKRHTNEFKLLKISKGIIQLAEVSTHVLLALKTVIAVYQLDIFKVPRPKALLGHENLQQILKTITTIITNRKGFKTFKLSVAGEHTSVMQRIKQEIATHTRLTENPQAGDLLVRIKPIGYGEWAVLTRLTQRPLATRQWRTINMLGALSAPVAYAINHIANVQNSDFYLNVGCGSGTLLIEQFTSPQHNVGCDLDQEAIEITKSHLITANQKADLLQADMQHLPFPENCFTIVTADLPFGQLVGSPQENQTLYPNTLAEIARITKKRGQFILITHAIKLIESTIANQSYWAIKTQFKITLNGLHPRIYLLERL